MAGWRYWISGGGGWKLVVLALLALHVSFLPWPRRIHAFLDRPVPRYWLSPWAETAWDTHQFSNRIAADYFAIYEAGYRTLHGIDPYSVNTDRTPMAAPTDFAAFRYLPITAVVLAAPLALLPPWISYSFWIVLSELLLLFNLGLTVALAGPRLRRPLGALWLVYVPLHIEWHMGQFSFFMACLLFWCGVGLWQARYRLASTWWGVSTWLKNWTVLFWPFWILRRRAALAATLWVAVLTVTTAGYFFLNPASFEVFLNRATDRRLAGGVDDLYWGRQGVQMLPAVLLAGGRMPEERRPAQDSQSPDSPDRQRGLAEIINALLSAGALAVIGLAFFRFHQQTRRRMGDPVPLSNGNPSTPPADRSDVAAPKTPALSGKGAPPASGGAPLPLHSLDLLALIWLWWFFAYLDTWEHHYVMLLPLLALLGATGRLAGIHWWIPALLCALPSLWSVAGPAVATRDPFSPLWVILYFAQRPVAVLWIFARIAKRAWNPATASP